MKFTYKEFSCDVDIFYSGDDILLRFYDSLREQTEKQIHDLVIVDSGYGFLCSYIPNHVDLVDYTEYNGEY